MIKSQPINIIRYKNGTLIKLTPSAEGFMSYDYNVISGAATYAPEQIDIVAKAEGDLTVDKWEYSYDGETWYEVINGEDGIAINDNVLSIIPSSPLFSDTQSTVTFKCTGSDGEHYDTVMITRHVDPLYIYRTTNANIEQTNSKIRLIASDEQLNQFTVGKTMMSKVAEIEQTANGIKSTVETKYATKVYADASAGTAESNAKDYAKTYADSSAGAAETNAKAYADSTSEAAEQNAKDYADNSANTAESNAKSYAKTYADTASGTAEQNAKQYAATSASNAESRAKAYADTKETTLRSEISQTASGIRSEVVMKDGFEESVGSVIEQKADSIRMQASKIAWQAQNSSMTEDGTLTCQNAVIGGTIEVGKTQNKAGEIILYDTNNTEQARLNATGMTFKPDGQTIYNGKIYSGKTGEYYDSQTVLTDSQLFFYIDGQKKVQLSGLNNTSIKETDGKYNIGYGIEAGANSWLHLGVLNEDNTYQNAIAIYSDYVKGISAAAASIYFYKDVRFTKEVTFAGRLMAEPYRYTKFVWGKAVNYPSSSRIYVTLFGPFVHVYFNVSVYLLGQTIQESNMDNCTIVDKLPGAVDLYSYGMISDFYHPRMRINCAELQRENYTLGIYPWSEAANKKHCFVKMFFTPRSAKPITTPITFDARLTGEFTYVINPNFDY